MLAPLALERNAECLFQRLADSKEGCISLRALDASKGVAGVRGEEPRHVGGPGKWGGILEDAPQEVVKARRVRGSQRVGVARRLPESGLTFR